MQKQSNYPLPLVGALQCEYVGYDLSCEGIGKETDMSFAWTFRHQRARGGKRALETVEIKREFSEKARRCVWRGRPFVLPRPLMIAAFTTALYEKVSASNRERFPFLTRSAKNLNADSEVHILAVGAAKPLTSLPKRKSLLDDELGNEKEFLMISQIVGDLWLTHPGGDPYRRNTLCYFTRELAEKNVRALDPKKHKCADLPDNRPTQQKERRFPENVAECNDDEGTHAGIRRAVAAGVCIAEIRRAKLEKRDVDLQIALSRFELDVAEWSEHDHKKGRALVLWQADGEHYVNVLRLDEVRKCGDAFWASKLEDRQEKNAE